MTLAVVALVALGVLLWPRGRRPVPTTLRRREESGAEDVRGLRTRIARRWSAEVRLRSARSGWVAEFAELSAVGLDAGLPPVEAARLACEVGAGSCEPMRDVGTLIASTQADGGRLGEALCRVADDDRDLAFLAAAWRLSEELGAASAPAARLTADVLRERAASAERRSVLAAGPRASMWLLTLLPLTGPLVAVVLGLPVVEVYGSTTALVAAGAGLCLTGSGWWWSRRLLRRALRPAVVS